MSSTPVSGVLSAHVWLSCLGRAVGSTAEHSTIVVSTQARMDTGACFFPSNTVASGTTYFVLHGSDEVIGTCTHS